MTLKQALAKIGVSVEAYRALHRDDPEDYFESARRQQEAADLLDEAQALGSAFEGDDARRFAECFVDAVSEIESLEARRTHGRTDAEEVAVRNGAALNERVARYFPYLAFEFSEADREDLADSVRAAEQEHRATGSLPNDLADILAIGIELRLGTAVSAEWERQIVEFVRNSAVLEANNESAQRVETVLHVQQIFRDAKRRADTMGMRQAQDDFKAALGELGEAAKSMEFIKLLSTSNLTG